MYQYFAPHLEPGKANASSSESDVSEHINVILADLVTHAPNSVVKVLPGMEDYLTADETAFLRLVCLENMDAFLLESVFRDEVWGFMQEPVSRDNEKRMLDTLIATCEGALSSFQTSDAQDRKALAADSSRDKYAAAVRLSEKAALKNTILILEEELEDLDDKEYYQERRLRLLNLDRPLDESEIIDPDVDIRRENIPGM